MPQFWHMENGNNNTTHFIVLLRGLNKISQSYDGVGMQQAWINGNTVNGSYYIEVMYNSHIIIMLRCVYLHFSGDEVT